VHRSIKALSQHIQPLVIHFRALKPGRKMVENRVWDGINVLSLAVPQLPFGSYSHLNTRLMETFGFPFVKSLLQSADLIHGAEAYPAGFVAGKWALKTNKPFTFNVIGSDLGLFLSRNYDHLSLDWLNNLRGVVCNSQALQSDLISLMGPLNNVTTIYRGVDTQAFSPTGEKSGPQEELPPVRFLFLGGFHTFDEKQPTYNLKGGNSLLQAWQLVDQLDVSASLVVGGPGDYQTQFIQWKNTLRHPKQVFYAGAIKPSKVPCYIRSSDVVIIPSLSEGLPNLAKEAQACGKPVLGTNVGGIPEVVVDGVTGKLVPSEHPQALSQGIQWFCDHQNKLLQMGQIARKRMMDLFSWRQYQAAMLNFFNRILVVGSDGK